MTRKSQRKKQRDQRRREKLKRQDQKVRSTLKAASTHLARHQQRLEEQVPVAWPGELPADVAVFDDSALASLPSELATQARDVREALRLALASQGEEALQRTAEIPRSSPLSEWRLLIRGLVSWLGGDEAGAASPWQRLDTARRPGRISRVLLASASLPSDEAIDSALSPAAGGDGGKASSIPEAGESTAAGPSPRVSELDEQLSYHAKLLYRIRFARPALQVARQGVALPEEEPKLLLGRRKLRWLHTFIAAHNSIEPELCEALAQVALGRAFSQPFTDVFTEATKTLQGPRHDPSNLLLTFFYYSQFDTDDDNDTFTRKSDAALRNYLVRSLPQNTEISEPLRSAIASQIHLNVAGLRLAEWNDPRARWERQILNKYDDYDQQEYEHYQDCAESIYAELTAAIEAYPANLQAHQLLVEWLRSLLDENERLSKLEREMQEEELAEAMQAWSEASPEDPEPRLWLFDWLLRHERLEEAAPHVQWLSTARSEDPLVRAATWKWQLLEAMRLCRRKKSLGEAPQRLDEAEQLWPAWLSRQWLAYLRAAWSLRSGGSEAFAPQYERACQEAGSAPDSLAAACQMLGAAQKMHVPTADLKVVREVVERQVKQLADTPLEDLLAAGSFFWDLDRTGLLYPAYRRHGSKIGKALLDRLEESCEWIENNRDSERLQRAVLWCSQHRFWSYGYPFPVPNWLLLPALREQPMFAAARLNTALKLRLTGGLYRFGPDAEVVREAIATERDPFFRHWFTKLTQQFDATEEGQRPPEKVDFFTFFADHFAEFRAAVAAANSAHGAPKR